MGPSGLSCGLVAKQAALLAAESDQLKRGWLRDGGVLFHSQRLHCLTNRSWRWEERGTFPRVRSLPTQQRMSSLIAAV